MSSISVRCDPAHPWIVDSGCSKHKTGNLQLLRKFVEKFMGTVRFGNDHFAAITGYGYYVIGNITICHVYYVEGLRHNLFSVREFCDGHLKVAFRSNTCYVWNLEGDDLLIGYGDSNLYTSSISKMVASSRVCLMSRATSIKSWLWHRKLSHLNFDTINQLTSKDLVNGLSKFKYNKDHLCSTCEQSKSKKASLPLKLVPSTESKLELLHIDLSRPMRNFFGPKLLLLLVSQNRSIVHTWYNKTPYELIRGRKPNIQYFYVFGSLCYPTNDHDNLRKMKPKAGIGIFIAYSESSRGFRIYNRQTKKIMETIHVKFDEFTSMASECNNSELGINCMNFQDSSKDSQSVPSKTDLDNLFGPLYEEYYATSSPELSDNSSANTLDNENTSSSSSIVVEEDEAPQIVSSSAEQIVTEPNSPVLNENANELVQEDFAEFDGNVFYNPPQTSMFEEAESSSTYQDPSNMHEFHQKHCSCDKLTKNHPIEHVIDDPSNLVMLITKYGVSTSIGYGVSNFLSNTTYSTQKINMAYPLPLDTAYRSSVTELDPKRHFKTLSLDELRSPDFNLLSDQEYLEEEVAESMAKIMEQYMSKTRADYGSGVARPKIDNKDNFERKDQVMLRAFPMSLTEAASRWLRNKPIAKKMEEINNFQQEPDENLYQAWERFTKLLMKCPQHYLTEMQEVVLFYNGLDVLTRQIIDSKGAIQSKTAADAQITIQEMAEYSQKWHNGTSRVRSTETFDGLAAIQAQLNNLGREIKKVNEKVYAAQVGCEQCKGPHYTKDCPLKEEGKTLKEAYYTQFDGPFQGGGYKATTPGYYQRNNANPSYQERRQSMEDTLSKFMSESAKRHEEIPI
ncbi:retrovirus-related pol polyprotein from transposon TNT 1-94 [Tanacetum coccineum]